MIIPCQSAIDRVTVYARGAMITRRVLLPPELPEGAFELEIAGISPLAQPATMRAAVEGDRTVLALRAPLQVPRAPAGPGASLAHYRQLQHRLSRLDEESRHLAERRNKLGAMRPTPYFGVTRTLPQVGERMSDGLAASALLDDLGRELAARADAIDEARRLLSLEIEAALVALRQARSSEQLGEGHPTRSAILRLSESGHIRGVELSYVITAARWWPLYTLRISDGGRGASLAMEALVAQRSGEDWRDARLSLATADLAHDASLPSLPSLRLGRAQPPVRTGYRPPPPGLDELFAGYDRAFAQAAAPVPPPPQGEDTSVLFSLASLVKLEESRVEHEIADVDDDSPYLQRQERVKDLEAVPKQDQADKKRMGRLSGSAPGRGGMAPQAARSNAMPVLAATPMMSLGGMAFDGAAGGGGAAPEPPEPAEVEPTEDYLDFGRLRLATAAEPRRGRLVRAQGDATARLEEEARSAIEAASPQSNVRDPLASRGHFAHRYDAAGLAEVPSDGQGHLVPVATATATPKMLFRCVPREAAEVYREALFTNPFSAPLLAGPVQIYVDGTLLTVTPIDRVGQGGTLRVGLGVEERLRVARNTRTQEGSSGLLNGSTTMTHAITIELGSSLGRAAEIEVIDRQPVTDDKSIEIERVSASPEPKKYDQAERGEPVRGGLFWQVTVPAGGAATIEHQYRLTLPAKCEIIGGNRRE
jgi:hypothetical protein